MAWRQIDRARWGPVFAQVAKSLIGKQAEIEVASLELGDQVEARRAALIGVAYDDKDDLIEVALEALDHVIRSPREVFVDSAVGGVDAIAIVDKEGRRQIIRFADLPSLPATSGDPTPVEDPDARGSRRRP